MIPLLLWLAAAPVRAQEAPADAREAPAEEQPAVTVPEAAEEAPPPAERAAIEVYVYEQFLVDQARKQVYADLQDAGFTEVVRKDDHMVFRHPDPWKSEVHVYDDGWIRIKRQKVQVEGREMPWAEKNSPLAWAGCVIWLPLCVRPGGQVLSRRKQRANETRIMAWTGDDVQDWGDRIADLSTSQKVNALPDALEDLWERGIPIEGEGPMLPDPASRRAALLAFWGSRTDTVWGAEVQDAVGAFVRAVVQHSDHPFTEEEVAAFNATRPDRRPFSLQPPPVEE